MTAFVTTVVTLFFSLCHASTSEGFVGRGTFYGGYALSLPASGCPSGTDLCSDISTGACCPSGSRCDAPDVYSTTICCPGSSDCSGAAEAAPICASSNWTLYAGQFATEGQYFCCTSDQTGIVQSNNGVGGQCVPSDAVPATASTANSVGVLSATASGASGASATTSDSTGASTTTGGKATATTSSKKPGITINVTLGGKSDGTKLGPELGATIVMLGCFFIGFVYLL